MTPALWLQCKPPAPAVAVGSGAGRVVRRPLRSRVLHSTERQHWHYARQGCKRGGQYLYRTDHVGELTWAFM